MRPIAHASVNGVQRIPATDVITAVTDPNSFEPWSPADLGIATYAPENEDYRNELDAARAKTGRDESVQVGRASVDGNKVVVLIGDFDFLAGSAGRAACQLLIAAMNRAIAESLPVFASPTSGGTRMQEGTPAFVLMADVAHAVARVRSAGLLFAVWLRHPTTGGVMATWGSLGTVTFGQPQALAGFLGPRVFEVLGGEPFPAGIQQTDNLANRGVIDGVVPLVDLRRVVSRLVDVTSRRVDDSEAVQIDGVGGSARPDADGASAANHSDEPAWHNVTATRQPSRPGARELIAAALTQAATLSGTGEGQRSNAISVKIGRWHGRSVVVVAQDRAAQADGELIDPAALQTARRGFRIAAELSLPLVTVIDTPGAELSVDAEEGGLAGQIARCLAELTELPVPTISVLLGMGCGGAAIALLPADTVIAAERSWVSPLPLEGASVIRYRTADRAPQMADQQRVTATLMAADGIVDFVVPEGDSALDQDGSDAKSTLVIDVAEAVARAITALADEDHGDRLHRRNVRYSGGLG